VTSYNALAEVYEWLISDAKLAPTEFAASFDDVLSLLPPNAHVLDCSCGTGQLAVGLAGLGMQVVATDASEAMVRRTAELSEEFRALSGQCGRTGKSCPTISMTTPSTWCSALATRCTMPWAREAGLLLWSRCHGFCAVAGAWYSPPAPGNS
jgi:SAM-dependent methyltransferase